MKYTMEPDRICSHFRSVVSTFIECDTVTLAIEHAFRMSPKSLVFQYID